MHRKRHNHIFHSVAHSDRQLRYFKKENGRKTNSKSAKENQQINYRKVDENQSKEEQEVTRRKLNC